MIHSGCDLNLIKKRKVEKKTWVNRNKKYNLVEIGSEVAGTLGEIRAMIKGIESSFQIVPDDFPIFQSGILGMSFLKSHKTKLIIGEFELNLGNPELPDIAYSTIKIPVQTKKMVEIPIHKTHLNDGYIRQIIAGPGIFIGRSLVSRVGNCVNFYVINNTTSDMSLTLPDVELEDWSIILACRESDMCLSSTSNAEKEKAKRFTELLKILHLEGLNEEENV